MEPPSDALPGERIPGVVALLLCVLGVYLAMTAIGRLNDLGRDDSSEEVAP